MTEIFEVTHSDAPIGPAPIETVQMWFSWSRVMGPDELESFEQRTFRTWDRASLVEVRWAIDRRRRELAR